MPYFLVLVSHVGTSQAYGCAYACAYCTSGNQALESLELPKDVLIHLTDQKPDSQESRQLNAERQSGIKSDSNKSQISQVRGPMTTTDALFSNVSYPPKIPKASKRETCIYCKGKHWSDECQKFTTLAVSKEKIKGRCYICLKKGPSHPKT